MSARTHEPTREPTRGPTEGADEARTAPVFDVLGPLPTGTTVLEASAGTGKTFTIAALATRYVAEGVAELPELLLVTFGRAATSELRDRVRERLVSAERALRGPGAGTADDPLVRHLAAVDDAELGRRRERLTRALAQFDKSLAMDPSHAKTLLNVGIVRAFGKQDLKGASEAWQKVVQLSPNSEEGRAAKQALDAVKSAHPDLTGATRPGTRGSE